MRFPLLPLVALAVLASIHAAARAAEWAPVPGPLMTPWAAEVSPTNALSEYPRPQMVRPKWQSLNGLWDCALTDRSAAAPQSFDGRILVPFPIESPLSGVKRPLAPDRRLWYWRTFTVPADWRGGRVLLHFGAVDFEAAVSVNGKPVGSHRGGYDAFTLDITDALRPGDEQEVIVSVLDPTDAGPQLRGKQSLHPAGAFYTASSGIWQTIWIEPVGASSITSLKMIPDLKTGALRLTVEGSIAPAPLRVEVEAFDGETSVAKTAGTLGGEITPAVRENLVEFYKATATFASATSDLPIKNPKRWSPDHPFLYCLTVTLTDGEGKTLDTVKSYFGMRSVAVGTDADGHARPMLNGEPVLLAGVLEQAFWPDGTYTAPTDAALKFDIEAMKQLGLDAVRKHVKVKPDRWYYWCDTLGLLVLQDMPSGEGAGDPKTDRILNPAAAAIAPAARGEPLPAAAELAGPGEWAYTTDAPPSDWAAPSFDAGAWRRGAQPFGAGYGGLKTEWATPDICLRQEFNVSNLPKHPMLRIRHDETVHAYLNGVPAATDGGHIDAPDDFPLSPAAAKALKVGRNVIAVRCHQTVGGQLVDVNLVDVKE